MSSYDVAIFGDLLFEDSALLAWKRATVTSAGSRVIAQAFPKRKNEAPARVAMLLSEFARLGFFRLEALEGLVRVHGQFQALAFDKRARQLAALFMSAARFGAQGTITFLGEGVWLGYEIFLDAGTAKLRVMTEDEVRRAAHDPALDVISGHFQVAAPSRMAIARSGDSGDVVDPDVSAT